MLRQFQANSSEDSFSVQYDRYCDYFSYCNYDDYVRRDPFYQPHLVHDVAGKFNYGEKTVTIKRPTSINVYFKNG